MKSKEMIWDFPCSSCGTHDSFWKSVVTSPQWEAWEKEIALRMKKIYYGGVEQVYDIAECRECGWISQEHFQDFLEFTLGKK